MAELLRPESTAAIFLDRDGTLNRDSGYLSRPEQLELYPFAAQAVRLINQASWKAVLVTNQSGVARGLHTEDDLTRVHDRLIEELGRSGAKLDAIYYCPHHPDFDTNRLNENCDCRKPLPGMLHRAAREMGIDLSRSYVIGDKVCDIELAEAGGATGVLVRTGYGTTTLSHRENWPRSPGFIADNVLDAVTTIFHRLRETMTGTGLSGRNDLC